MPDTEKLTSADDSTLSNILSNKTLAVSTFSVTSKTAGLQQILPQQCHSDDSINIHILLNSSSMSCSQIAAAQSLVDQSLAEPPSTKDDRDHNYVFHQQPSCSWVAYDITGINQYQNSIPLVLCARNDVL